MSHRITATIKVWDEDAVRATLEEMGLAVEENAVWHGFYQHQRDDVRFLVPPYTLQDQRYGVGFKQDPITHELVIIQESMGGPGSERIVKEFRTKYQINMAIRKLRAFGYDVKRLPDGTYRARATARTAKALNSRNRKATTGQTIQVGRY